MITPEWLMKLHPAWERHNNRWNILLKTSKLPDTGTSNNHKINKVMGVVPSLLTTAYIFPINKLDT